MIRGRPIPLAIAAGTLLTWLLFAFDADTPLRALVAVPFLMIGPGLALVMLLRIAQPLTVMTLAVATSLALEALVATALLETGLWTPGRALTIVGGITLTATALRLTGVRFRLAEPTGVAANADLTAGEKRSDQ